MAKFLFNYYEKNKLQCSSTAHFEFITDVFHHAFANASESDDEVLIYRLVDVGGVPTQKRLAYIYLK